MDEPSPCPLIHLRALDVKELPSHPTLASEGDPSAFAGNVLDEAEKFMTADVPTFKVKGMRDSPPSAAKVELSTKEFASETWFARKSVHQNAAVGGTASWEEFDEGLRKDHSQHEMEYTPGVIDANEVVSWGEEIASSEAQAKGWQEVKISVMEMLHKIPALNNRVFPVVVVTAKKGSMFLVVQIPVKMEGLSGKYVKKAGVTEGMYCSIERCELVGENVVWQMATASDAKGVLPMWVQKMGVPGAVVKDVGLFMGWVEGRRGR